MPHGVGEVSHGSGYFVWAASKPSGAGSTGVWQVTGEGKHASATFQVLEQGFARATHHLVDGLEAALTVVVGIRHVGVAVGQRIELPQQMQGGVTVGACLETAQIPEVLAVHGNDMVEPVEIRGFDLPSVPIQSDAVSGGGLGGAGIGGLADMPGARTGGVDIETVLQAGFPGEIAKDAFGHRRSTDIAEADEKNRRTHGIGRVGIHPAEVMLHCAHGKKRNGLWKWLAFAT